MSERHGVQEATLRNWANLGYITSCRMGNQLFLDDESLTAYLEAHKRLGLQADYLAKIVEEKKLERDFIISRYEICYMYCEHRKRVNLYMKLLFVNFPN